MKTIVETATKQSKYLFEDNKALTMNSDSIIVGKDPVDFIVMDLNKGNTTLYEDVSDAPKDWVGCKYLYDGSKWEANPTYVEPKSD
jgi:hypothetical protein